ncbi:Phosphatidylinositol 3- and 4-kinase, putative [Angomonas deanei]|uniref:1-phosphatidylinositol 4-kinase n=1 Tax=Angomonas deanei TaxID=59799 RepID=A0A7G2CA00_9TRYP|nr:Phosphatidylinositol 3- and 4-kinase, putative [Angomonas deanei]
MSGRRSADRQKLLSALQTLSSPQSSQEEQMKSLGKLFHIHLDTLEDCLLQVSHVCITHTQPEIQQQLVVFLMWLAGRSLYVALRLSWIVDSVSDFFARSGMDSQVKRIQDRVETCAINQDATLPPQWSKDASPNAGDASKGGEETDVNAVLRKEQRVKLFNDVRSFVKFLTDLSDQLRYFPDRPKRKLELRKRLDEVNELLPGFRLMHPLGKSTDPVRWIVRIAVEECTVFSSRERAPFLIRYEVIVDSTTTMKDPTKSTLRNVDGTFRVSSTSEEVFQLRTEEELKAEGDGEANPIDNEFIEKAFGESAEERLKRLRVKSPWGAHPNWSISSMIIKAGDDLRQEELALQLISVFDSIWQEAGLTVQTYPYIALPTNYDSGLLEVVEESNSMDGIKKACNVATIDTFYSSAFGSSPDTFSNAQRNFTESVAAYSVISYLLQIKDRHNGNLMITREGRLVHIDFGFLFTTSPGGINFESAPFKLSQELIEVMGGTGGDMFAYFKVLIYQALEVARERSEELLALVALMIPFNSMPCFGSDPPAALSQLQNRFRYDLYSGTDYALYAKDLISNSADNWRTRRYDQFQTFQNGIL